MSVLLPFRDVEATLEEAIQSVLAEDLDLELVAIDDGSRDESAAIARDLAASDARLRVHAAPGAGIAQALQHATSLARAPLIARMDGDDVSLPGRLARSLDALARDPSLSLVATRVEAFPAPAEGMRRYVEWQNALLTRGDHAREIFVEAPVCHPSVTLRAEALARVGGYRDGAFAEDYDLWLRMHRAGLAMEKLPEVLLRWRVREGRATFTDPRYALPQHRALKAEHLAAHASRASAGRALVVWGAGPTGRRLARALEAHGASASMFVDIDPRKIGRVARGARIADSSALDRAAHYVIVAVGARGARELIRSALAGLGFVEGRDFVCAA